MKKEGGCVTLARDLIGGYFDNLASRDMINVEGLMEAFALKTDNGVLLEHINAWINILNDAKEELEKE